MRTLHILIFSAITWLACFTANAKVITLTSSDNLVTGENCYVTFIVEMKSLQPPNRPDIPVTNAFFQIYDTNVIAQSGRRFYRLVYRFNSPNKGTFTIPSTTFTPGSPDDISAPITLTVRDKTSLNKKRITSKSLNPSNTAPPTNTYTYYTQLIAQKSPLYPNEATRLEYKIYLPKSLKVAQWGLPSGDKENATAWRFETPDTRSINGDVTIKGTTYQVGRFHTTVSGIKPGKATLGPFKTRIVHHVAMINRMGSFLETQEIFPLSDTIQLDILDLPPNPPADFKGDVGSFKMSVNIETKPQLTPAESIKADITLMGRGKFSEITPPSLTHADHWKLISESKRDLGELRKNLEAFAEFTYLIQPTNTGPPTTTPGFSFSYLDPDLKAYQTLTYPGVPVTVKLTPTASTDSNLSNPTDPSNQMLGIIEGTKFTQTPWYKNLPLYLIHIIPGALCLLLLFKYALQKRQAIRLNQSHKIIQRKTLNELAAHDGETFLKTTSNYIQRWVDTEKHPEFKDIQQLRDDHCYKPDQPIKLSEKRKTAIIDALKKLTILLFLIAPQFSHASPDSEWNKAEYNNALTQYQAKLPSHSPPTSPDLLYNIGNCHQKLDHPGLAAVFYHRALLLDPYHSRAKHNLTLIQNQQTSIVSSSYIKSGSLQDWISTLSLNTYYITLSLSLWFILIAILYLKILKPKNKITLIISLAMLALCTASLSGYAYFMHPHREKISGPPFAIIINPSHLTEQPITGSHLITTTPPASECHILSSRGTYSYIELPDKTKGWLHSHNLIKVIE
ncbi:MAG: hypothetical protein ACSHX6_01340 [Akkermansiaceae bacterium]